LNIEKIIFISQYTKGDKAAQIRGERQVHCTMGAKQLHKWEGNWI